MKVKHNDIIEFLAISWDEPRWEFDYPSVLLSPVVRYSPNGDAPDYMIEDVAIDLSVEHGLISEDVSQEFNWRGWSLKTLNKVAKERLDGKDTWKTKIRQVLYQKIRFTYDAEGDCYDFEIIEQKTA